MSESWYYRTLGIQCGPISREALVEMVRCGRLTDEDDVRREDSTVWRRATDLIAHERPEASADDLDAMLAPDEPSAEDPSDLPNIDDITFGTNELTEEVCRPPIDRRWICRIRGRQVGPVEFNVMAELAQAGILSKTDRVRSQQEPKWVLAESIEGLQFGNVPTDVGQQNAVTGNVAPQRLSSGTGRRSTSLERTARPKGPQPVSRLENPRHDAINPPEDFAPCPSKQSGPRQSSEPPIKLPAPSECGPPAAPRPRTDVSSTMTSNSPAQRHVPPAAQSVGTTPPRPFTPSAPLASSRPATTYNNHTFSVPRPSRSSSFSVEDLIGSPAIKYALFAAVGIVVVALGYWQFGASVGIRKGDRYYYDLAQGLYFAAKQAEDPDVLKTMGKQLTPVIEEIKAGTETRAKMGDEVAQVLLQCSQEFFPKLFSGDPKDREKNLQPIEAALKKAQESLEG